MPGTLYVVATPLGNLEDLSPRGLRVLRSVAAIACEDTRRTANLLSRFELSTPTLSCHRFNERSRLEPLLSMLREGCDVALVSDGGTPGVSDQGRLLVEAALEEDVPVVAVPGPSAVVALLSASGLPADRFVFDGFLPHRAGERRRRLRELRLERRTVVVFEAPHRILATLADIADVLGDRTLVLGREMTKRHECVLRGTARTLAARLSAGPVRGEITLALRGWDGSGGMEEAGQDADRVRQAWTEALQAAGGDRRAALRQVARALGIGRSELYRRLSELGEDEPS